MNAPSGTMIAYATAPGSTASDGDGNNGLYTASLLKNISNEGLSVEEVFKQVRVDVIDQSHGKQTPWEATSLTGDFYFLHRGDGPLDSQEKISDADNYLAIDPIVSDYSESKGYFIDSRDNQRYDWIKIGNRIWMSENINYDCGDDCWCYKNDETMCDKYGKLYTWEKAVNICPKGWHLPDDKEWRELINLLGITVSDTNRTGYYCDMAGDYLKTNYDWHSNGNGTNKSGFSALPAGLKSHGFTSFGQIYEYAFFWTCTSIKKKNALYWVLSYRNDKIIRNDWNKSDALSVRCVKDQP